MTPSTKRSRRHSPGRPSRPALAESVAAAPGDSGPVDRTCVMISESPRAVSASVDTPRVRPDLTARCLWGRRASWLRLRDPLRSCRGTLPHAIEMPATRGLRGSRGLSIRRPPSAARTRCAPGEERVSCRFVRKPWFDGIPGTRDATVELGVTQSHCTSTGSLVDVADTGSPACRAAALLPRHSAQVRGERDMTVPGTGGGRCCGDTPSCRPSDHRERAFG